MCRVILFLVLLILLIAQNNVSGVGENSLTETSGSSMNVHRVNMTGENDVISRNFGLVEGKMVYMKFHNFSMN